MYGIPDKPAPCNPVISLVTSGHGYDGVDAIQHGTATKSTLHRRTAASPCPSLSPALSINRGYTHDL